MQVRTKRLLVRDFVPDDWPPVHVFLCDPEVARHTWFANRTEEETRQWFDDCIFHNSKEPRSSHNCGIVLERGDVIGWIGFGDPSRQGIGDLDFGYALRRDQWSQGYMTEALTATLRFCFEEAGAGSVFGECRPENPASARVMEKAGMEYSGLFPSSAGLVHKRYLAFREPWLQSNAVDDQTAARRLPHPPVI